MGKSWLEVQTLHPKEEMEGLGGREEGEQGFVDCSSGEEAQFCKLDKVCGGLLRVLDAKSYWRS